MSLGASFEDLLTYSDHERAKWKAWIGADPVRLGIPFQAGGRFPTFGSLLDHVFLVERRHLARLEGSTPPDATGVPEGSWRELFDYADLVRADLRSYVGELTEQEGTQSLTFAVQSGTFTMTRRKLAVHILIHEIRHFAQLAYAARLAGHEPPGQHDFFYSPVA